MIELLARPLAAKIGLGLIAALLLALGVQTVRLSSVKHDLTEARQKVADCEASRRVVNAELRAAWAEVERQRESFDRALEAGQERIRAAQRQSAGMRQTPLNGCPTPPQILEAPL